MALLSATQYLPPRLAEPRPSQAGPRQRPLQELDVVQHGIDTRVRRELIVELRSGRLLGAQIVGEENAGKRIDALAIALWNEMTVEEMTGLDLAYAPPFSPVWDPVLIAARKAAERLDGTTGPSSVEAS